MILDKLSAWSDRLLERLFQKLSPYLRSSSFCDTGVQAVILIGSAALFGILVAATAFLVTQTTGGVEQGYEFVVEPGQEKELKMPAIGFQDSVHFTCSVNRTADIDIYLVSLREYRKWEDDEEKLEDLEVLIKRLGMAKEEQMNATSHQDGTHYLIVINNEDEPVTLSVDLKTEQAPALVCSPCVIFFLIIAIALLRARPPARPREWPQIPPGAPSMYEQLHPPSSNEERSITDERPLSDEPTDEQTR